MYVAAQKCDSGIPRIARDIYRYPFPLSFTGKSPVSINAPGNVSSHFISFSLFVYVALTPSRQPHSSREFCGLITIQSGITRIFTAIPALNPARVTTRRLTADSCAPFGYKVQHRRNPPLLFHEDTQSEPAHHATPGCVFCVASRDFLAESLDLHFLFGQ